MRGADPKRINIPRIGNPPSAEETRAQEKAPPERRTGRAHIPHKRNKGPRGDPDPPRALPASAAARAHIEKRPPRARRPALPQPGAAVLSAKAGLTAGFGMGPGDPRLCGRARGGRSPAAQCIRACQEPLPGRPWRPHGGHGRKLLDASTPRKVLLIEDAKSSGYQQPLG